MTPTDEAPDRGEAPDPVEVGDRGEAPDRGEARDVGEVGDRGEAPDVGEAPDSRAELDVLAAELRRVVAIADPVPERWRSVATAAYAWAAIDAAAAALVYDSHAVRGGRVGTSHVTGPTVREMRFAAGSLAVEVDVDAGADKVRVFGRVTPARAVEIAALWPEGQAVTTCDDEGSYRFDELPRRPLCLLVTAEPAVKTAWIVP